MNDAESLRTNRVVKITQGETINGHVTSQPHLPDARPLGTNHQVYVGSDEDGWVQVPYVTNVVLDLKQGELRRAVITVMFPQVEFDGGPPR
jgi:hypothetical protein